MALVVNRDRTFAGRKEAGELYVAFMRNWIVSKARFFKLEIHCITPVSEIRVCCIG